MSHRSQREQVLDRLRAAGVVCGVTFLEMHIPRYAARIKDLQDEGYNIVRTKCPYGYHRHSKRVASYKLDFIEPSNMRVGR
jgi:hypothetical protein